MGLFKVSHDWARLLSRDTNRRTAFAWRGDVSGQNVPTKVYALATLRNNLENDKSPGRFYPARGLRDVSQSIEPFGDGPGERQTIHAG
jgi:hypothetical protein